MCVFLYLENNYYLLSYVLPASAVGQDGQYDIKYHGSWHSNIYCVRYLTVADTMLVVFLEPTCIGILFP